MATLIGIIVIVVLFCFLPTTVILGTIGIFLGGTVGAFVGVGIGFLIDTNN